MGLREKLEMEMYAYVVGKVMFCPVTGSSLDVRTAVVVESADQVKTFAVCSPEGWEQVKDEVLPKLPADVRVVVNGKVQDK